MGDVRERVHVLLATGDGHAQQRGGGIGAVHRDVILVARGAVEQGDAVDEHVAALVLTHMQARQTVGARRALLHVVVFDGGTFHGDDFHHLHAQIVLLGVLGVVAHQHLHMTAGLGHYQCAAHGHDGCGGVEDVDHL